MSTQYQANEQLAAETAPDKSHAWTQGDSEPGPEVTAVTDSDGDRWERQPEGVWVCGLGGDQLDWACLLACYGPVTDATGQPAEPVYPAPGSTIPRWPGYVVGECGHRVARSEWRAGYRVCERCPRTAAEPQAPEGLLAAYGITPEQVNGLAVRLDLQALLGRLIRATLTAAWAHAGCTVEHCVTCADLRAAVTALAANDQAQGDEQTPGGDR